MESAKIHFEQNIVRVKSLGSIYNSINNETTTEDISDILRAQYVMLVSALDHFIHEVVRLGMIETYNNQRTPTKKFKEFILSLDKNILFNKAIMEEKSDIWLNGQIRYKNGFKSFQESDKIKEALSLILEYDIWEKVSETLNDENITKKLNLIIDRRNKIAHEADIEPLNQELREIREDDLIDSIQLIENMVNAIFEICTNMEE